MHEAAYNQFISYCQSEFLNPLSSPAANDPILTVAQRIVQRLVYRYADPYSDTHPFVRYADSESSLDEHRYRLGVDIMSETQERHLKPYVHAFFHSGGVYRTELDELLETFYAIVHDDA